MIGALGWIINTPFRDNTLVVSLLLYFSKHRGYELIINPSDLFLLVVHHLH